MQNATAKLLFLLIVTGALFVGCAKTDESETSETAGSLEESVLGDLEGPDDTEDPDTIRAYDDGADEEKGDYSARNEDSATTNSDVPTSTGPSTLPTDSGATSVETSSYTDGTYSASGAYQSPAGRDDMGVTLVIKDGLVSSVSISQKATNETSIYFQDLFAQGVSAAVVGKPLDSLGSLSAVNGASLCTMGFASAVDSIKTLAKS